jgi:tRNA modification GTPase
LPSAPAGGADTIVPRATAAGRGALAVVRVSGPAAAGVAARVCPSLSFARGWRAVLLPLFDAAGRELERALVIPFPGPRSATGEDMFEATLHGSPYLVERLLEACVAAGARRAEPGEFTRRAVANGKLDLVQAEAVRDLVAAQTAWQARNARAQLEGALSASFRELREELLGLAAEVEGALDFAAQGVVAEEAALAARGGRCLERLAGLLATAPAGRLIRDGLRVVILGAPNAGKSTLFNTLGEGERAIVSPRPGTTRDLLDCELEVGGLRLVLQDTAGLGGTTDELEAEGARRARAAAAAADLVLLLWSVDADGGEPEGPAGVPTLRVCSRADLGPQARPGWLRVSCHSGEGLAALRAALAALAEREVVDLGGAVAIGARHRAALERARDELAAADWGQLELAAERLRWAIRALEELVGEASSEELLDRLFATFCIGK